MHLPKLQKPLVVIVGPTAVGKTDFSIQLAKEINGEIISSDSRLFYKGMDRGTAKPTLKERRGIPHHLIDIILPDERWSLADFQKEAIRIIQDIHQKGKIPILVGGTGQYIRGLLEGWSLPEVTPDFHLREAIEKWGKEIGAEKLLVRLAILDPDAAWKIDGKNLRRTVRALEVIFTSGELFSKQSQKLGSHFSYIIVGLKRNRKELYQRIDDRIDGMLRNGLIDEVKGLLAKGYSGDLPAFSAIGYSQLIKYLKGDLTLGEAVILIKRQSRLFVRRQANWFKETDPSIHWFDATQPDLMRMVLQSMEDSTCWVTAKE